MANKTKKKLRRYTLTQYVALHNNENRLLSERSIALVFLSSFLSVVWVVDSPIGWEVRLAAAFLGLLVTLMLWRVIFRSAQAAEDLRSLAIEEEKLIYFGWDPARTEFLAGTYRLRRERDLEREHSTLERIFRSFGRPGLGDTNVWSAFWIPLILTFWWLFAIAYTFYHDWDVVPTHVEVEVNVSVDNEADQTPPDHPD